MLTKSFVIDTILNYNPTHRNAHQKESSNIEYEFLENNKDFTDEMYQLYEQVFEHSQYSLEKLSADFFRNDISVRCDSAAKFEHVVKSARR